MNNTLKRCPFCGGRAEVRHVIGEYDAEACKYFGCYIQCTNCYTSSYKYNSADLAANAWNRRYYVD